MAYVVMAVPYFDNLPYLTELKRSSRIAVFAGLIVFALFFALFYLGALYLDEDTSGPLLMFAAFVIALPVSLLLGTETWDRRNGHGMSKVPGLRAVTVATSIGLAELSAFAVAFIVIL